MDRVVAPPALRRRVLQRDNYTCRRCGHKGEWGQHRDNVQVHHLLPCSLGGEHTMDNLLTLCDPCHRKEDAAIRRSIPDYWQVAWSGNIPPSVEAFAVSPRHGGGRPRKSPGGATDA
jgi:hypothetical protein